MTHTVKGPFAVTVPGDVKRFQKTVLDYYHTRGRRLPWRQTSDPYRIWIAEIMLQQTQVDRVVPKYTRFIQIFPNVASLAKASLRDVLDAWQGLGYNRRAAALKKSAELIMQEWNGRLPVRPEDLLTLPGIGTYTAAAICVFAYNQALVFIETNVRSVYIHFFFARQDRIQDVEIRPVVAATLYHQDPRRWYNALMDYGVMLKDAFPELGKKSAHYNRQKPFKGSNREIRGAVLKILLEEDSCTEAGIISLLGKDPQRVKRILDDLSAEGLVQKSRRTYRLPAKTKQ